MRRTILAIAIAVLAAGCGAGPAADGGASAPCACGAIDGVGCTCPTCACGAGGDGGSVVGAPSNTDEAEGPGRAVVHLDVRGCMSCDMCRTIMRRMAREEGGTIRFGGDSIEIDWGSTEPVSFGDLAARMERSGIRNLEVLGITFTAVGDLREGADGASFVVQANGQVLRVIEGIERLRGGPKRARLQVRGWREGGEPSVAVLDASDPQG